MSDRYTIHVGDCLDVLKSIPDGSIDSIVTDPPYGLCFMGKKWDYDVPSEAVWRECLRVLKPGGHLLAFAGTRTQHRMAVKIEDAGFEIRDMIAWVYGSGFPKSLDVSKAIDKRGGNSGLTAQIGEAIKAAREARRLSASECDRVFCGGTTNWSWFEGRPAGQRAPTHETFAKIAEAWPELAPLADAVAEAEREVVGQKTSGIANKDEGKRYTVGAGSSVVVDITAPATDAARQWAGWGTALKPALEPITVARKPLVGTVAENVLAHGTGAINVDGCRIEGRERTDYGLANSTRSAGNTYGEPSASADFDASKGRWPANLLHDGSDEVLALFPDSNGSGRARTLNRGKREDGWGMADQPGSLRDAGTGSAARFFQQCKGGHNELWQDLNLPPESASTADGKRFIYCAKASRKDRNEGLEDPGPQFQRGTTLRDVENAADTLKGNTHPTVKPTDLMRYLCRLVTPPGGVVLDPFMGSGSTGKAAMLEGFKFIGIERDEGYAEIARARVAAAS